MTSHLIFIGNIVCFKSKANWSVDMCFIFHDCVTIIDPIDKGEKSGYFTVGISICYIIGLLRKHVHAIYSDFLAVKMKHFR